MSKLMSFRIPKSTREQLQALSLKPGYAGSMTATICEAINLLWCLRANDEELVARYGTVNFGPQIDLFPMCPKKNQWSFEYHPAAPPVYQLCVEAAPDDIKTREDAIRHYARYWRWRLTHADMLPRGAIL